MKFDEGSIRHPERGVRKMFPTVAETLGEACSCGRDLCWSQLGLKPCKPYLLFEQTSYSQIIMMMMTKTAPPPPNDSNNNKTNRVIYITVNPLWPQNKWLHMPRTTDYRHTRQDRWIQTGLAFTLAKNATKPNPFEIIPLQTTRKENNWKNEEALAWVAVTLEMEWIEGSNPWCLWWWWWYHNKNSCFAVCIIFLNKKSWNLYLHLPNLWSQQHHDCRSYISGDLWRLFQKVIGIGRK